MGSYYLIPISSQRRPKMENFAMYFSILCQNGVLYTTLSDEIDILIFV